MTLLMTDLRGISAQLTGVVADLDPSLVRRTDVADLFGLFIGLERTAAAGRILLAQRLADTNQWKHDGYASAAEHQADLGGTSTGRAKADLGTSERLRKLEKTAEALRQGRLSAEQAEVVSDAATVNPAGEADLLDAAETGSVKNLKDEAGRKKAAGDPDPDATRDRIHKKRRCRMWTDTEGGWNLAARGTVETGARFAVALERLIDEKFAAARAAGIKEPRDAYAFDALIELSQEHDTGTSTGEAVGANAGNDQDSEDDRDGSNDGGHTEPTSTPPASTPPPAKSGRVNLRHLALIRVDLEALLRGAVHGDEFCEITGVGPVPVRTARNLLTESIIKLVITKGVDVVNVTSLGRGVTAAQDIALLWAHPMCTVEGCNRTRTQNDHRTPWAQRHETRLENIDPLCEHHHQLKTRNNWQLVSGTGRRPHVAPDDPRHPEHPSQHSRHGAARTTSPPTGSPPSAKSRTGRPPADAARAATTNKHNARTDSQPRLWECG